MSGAGLKDVGFADRQVIRPLLQRIGNKMAVSDARVSVEALRDLLKQQRQALCSDGAIIGDQFVRLAPSDLERGTGRITIEVGEADAVREDELLEGIDLFLQLLDRIEDGVRHGLFSVAIKQEASEAEQGTHRLCEVSK